MIYPWSLTVPGVTLNTSPRLISIDQSPIHPQATLSKSRLPHAFDCLVESRIDTVGVYQYCYRITSLLQVRSQVITIVALSERTASNWPASNLVAIHEQDITSVDSDVRRRNGCRVCQIELSTEQEPAV
ncbi:hypothetical protein D3C81_873850 [compost metagenome]